MQLELLLSCKCKGCQNQIPYFQHSTYGYCGPHYLGKLKFLNLNRYKQYRKIKNRIVERRQRLKNPIIKIRSNLGKRIRDLMFKYPKSKSKTIGCSGKELKLYLEKQFKPGMSWANYGKYGWHVDHIKPMAKFDLTDINEIEKVNHYTNLQPLWWDENILKGDSYGSI